MATTRCIRCGNPMLGVAQFCEDCSAQQRTEQQERAQRAAEVSAQRAAAAGTAVATPGTCPHCGNSVNPGANFCAWCRHQLRDDVPLELRKVEYAGFWIRFLAAIIDSFILGFLNIFIALGVKDPMSVFLLQSFVGPFYVIGFWITQGATPGKMALGLRVTTDDRDPIGVGKAIVRYFSYLASILTLGFGYLMIGFTAEKRGLHDFIAGTMVIKTR